MFKNFRKNPQGQGRALPKTSRQPQAASQRRLDGHYFCQGTNYRGVAVLRSLGENYAVHWNLDGMVYIGVGIHSGTALAVTIQIPINLTVIFDIQPDNSVTLSGRFCGFPAGGRVAEETLTFSHPLQSWDIGDEVLGNWSHDPFWYPGTIIEKVGSGGNREEQVANTERYLVRFADGDEEWLGCSRLAADLLTVGDYVYYTGGLFHRSPDEEPTINDQHVPDGTSSDDIDRLLTQTCKIIHRDGDALVLQYQDGTRQSTTFDCIRTLEIREAPVHPPPADGASNNTLQQ